MHPIEIKCHSFIHLQVVYIGHPVQLQTCYTVCVQSGNSSNFKSTDGLAWEESAIGLCATEESIHVVNVKPPRAKREVTSGKFRKVVAS